MPRRLASARSRRILAAVALIAAMLLPGIEPAAAEVTFTFEGGGYGHSVGMSQYGAYGMALEGYTWQQILRHYFTGASPAAADPALLAQPIWVGLIQDQTRIELKVTTTGAGSAAPLAITVGGTNLTAVGGQTAVIEALGGGTCRVTVPGGSASGPCSIDAVWDGAEEQPTSAIQLMGCVLPDWNMPGGTAWKPCRYARGSLHIRPDNDSATIHLSLEIGIEDYLLGISESPYVWGTTGGQAALEAQAVAARSYALYRVITRGDPASRPWCWCQLYDTTVDQFYVGWGHGTQTWLDAVAATTGQVMVHPSETRSGALIPIQTFYSSSTFGWTENSENGFTAYVPYLRAVDDHWSTLPGVGNPNARWSRSFTASRLASLLPGLSTVTGAQVTRCSETGAALEITFTGAGGPKAFSTRDLRSRLSLPSMQVIDVGTPADGSPACSGFALSRGEPGVSAVLAGVAVDDDNVEDSIGNGDGIAQCGESVEVATTLAAEGGDLRTVNAIMSVTDPYVSILWNTTSAFPDLPAGRSAIGLNDWDLAISPETPDGYTAHLTLRVSAANGGPWNLDVPLAVACTAAPTAVDAAVLAAPGDLNGDGTSDLVTAYARSGEPARLQVRDGATGAVLGTLRLGRAGYTPIAATVVPHFTGSPAAEVAILLTGPDRPSRVVVVDAAAGQKVRTFGLAHTAAYYDLAPLPAAGASIAPRLAVLTVKANGAARVLLRDAASGARLGGIGFGKSLAPVALAALTDTDGGPLVAVLGSTGNGELQAPMHRAAARGSLVRTLTFGFNLAPVDLVAVPAAGVTQLVAAVGNSPGGTSVQLVAANPANGEIVASGIVAGLGSAESLAGLADLGGGPSADVAVLGRATSGRAMAVVVDPAGGWLVVVTPLLAGYSAGDLTVLPPGQNLAAIGISPAGDALVTVRQGTTGVELVSFTVP